MLSLWHWQYYHFFFLPTSLKLKLESCNYIKIYIFNIQNFKILVPISRISKCLKKKKNDKPLQKKQQPRGPYCSQLTADDAVTQLHWELPADAEECTLHLQKVKKEKERKSSANRDPSCLLTPHRTWNSLLISFSLLSAVFGYSTGLCSSLGSPCQNRCSLQLHICTQ